MVPPQHGAWAFLGLPVAAGTVVSPWSPVLVPMLIAWVAAYPASYFVLAVVRDGFITQTREIDLRGAVRDQDFDLRRSTGSISGVVRSKEGGRTVGSGVVSKITK